MGLRRHHVLFVTAVALVGATAAACTTVLGLLEPTLDPCASGCPDASVPGADGSSSGGGDSTSPDVVADTSLPSDGTVDALTDAPPDAIPDVSPDQGPSNGTRCGPAASAVFCPLPEVCCLTFDDAGSASYACGSSASSCVNGGGYSIACTTNNDCNGSDICCFYSSSIKCEPQNTGSCTALVCDPSGPSDQCPTGQKCTVAYIIGSNYTLPYYGCH